jgi:hypothetical protein
MRTAVVLLALTACSSHYIPRSRGRVGVIMQGGTPAYVRDGEVHPHGFFGAGLEEAVRGNPAAERDAAEYHDRMVDGFLATIVGSVCMPVAVGYLAAESVDQPQDQGMTTNQEIAVGAALGCTALMFGGLFWAVSAEPYRWDAINRFNDTEPMYPAGPPGYSAALPRSSESLKMRD